MSLTPYLYKKIALRVGCLMELAYAKGKELGGLISGEHGIGSAKVRYLEEDLGSVVMDLMRQIKRIFDPKLLLNPARCAIS